MDEPIQLMEDVSQVGLVKNEPENIKKNMNTILNAFVGYKQI